MSDQKIQETTAALNQLSFDQLRTVAAEIKAKLAESDIDLKLTARSAKGVTTLILENLDVIESQEIDVLECIKRQGFEKVTKTAIKDDDGSLTDEAAAILEAQGVDVESMDGAPSPDRDTSEEEAAYAAMLEEEEAERQAAAEREKEEEAAFALLLEEEEAANALAQAAKEEAEAAAAAAKEAAAKREEAERINQIIWITCSPLNAPMSKGDLIVNPIKMALEYPHMTVTRDEALKLVGSGRGVQNRRMSKTPKRAL